jgi:hypothetical protein
MDIACRKEHSLYGNPQATDVACPVDPGAYHAGGTTCREGDESCQIGWEGNDEASLLGCALAIAYKLHRHVHSRSVCQGTGYIFPDPQQPARLSGRGMHVRVVLVGEEL